MQIRCQKGAGTKIKKSLIGFYKFVCVFEEFLDPNIFLRTKAKTKLIGN